MKTIILTFISMVTFSAIAIATLYNWIGMYFTKDQSLRMIIRPSKK